LTKGAYIALPLAVLGYGVAAASSGGRASFSVAAVVVWCSLWTLGFHQIHAYTHMGSRLSGRDFNQAVAAVADLPRASQERAMVAFFAGAGIPAPIRFLQRCRLLLRPEVHMRHHISFESDFSGVNGWSDPMTNWLYLRLVHRARERRPVL
jgi:hypothetical protein